MTIEELINELQQIKDKSKEIVEFDGFVNWKYLEYISENDGLVILTFL